mmetsp:Transcript_14923/g.42892  ORF Transcript_14923/g.42892 Transcript_14923/m.42892 type:complete len:210 (+) Transcript_14923:1013-1642(+)
MSIHPWLPRSFFGSKWVVHMLFKPRRPPTSAGGTSFDGCHLANRERTITGAEKRRYPTLPVSSATVEAWLLLASESALLAVAGRYPSLSLPSICGGGNPSGASRGNIAKRGHVWLQPRTSHLPSHVATMLLGRPLEKLNGSWLSGSRSAKWMMPRCPDLRALSSTVPACMPASIGSACLLATLCCCSRKALSTEYSGVANSRPLSAPRS